MGHSIHDHSRQRTAAHRAALALAASSVLSATAAHAGYSVQTSANTGRGYNRGCAAQYNVSATGARFFNNAGGGNPCVPGDFLRDQGATVAVSGSTDTTGTLTAAHDESSDVRLPDFAYATAAADLRTATVQLTASAANFAGANASARLADTLHFTVAGATATTVTYVPVGFAFDGKLVGTSDPRTASSELNYSFTFGNGSAYEFGDYAAGYYGIYGNYPEFVYSGEPRIGGWVSSSFASYQPLDTKFSGVYEIDGATADIPLDFFLAISAGNDSLDFAHTGRVTIGHVAGVSYTSDSGVFGVGRTVVPGAIPEPASWALMLVGFGAVGTAARRRQRMVAA